MGSSLITVAAVPQFDEGTYVGTLSSIEKKTIVPKQGKQAGEEVDIFEWRFDLAHLSDGEDVKAGDPVTDFDTGEPIIGRATSSTASGPRSKLSGFLVALLGPQAIEPGAQYGESDLVGKKALVTLVADGGGYPKVESLAAMPRSGRRQTVAQQAAPARNEEASGPPADDREDDDLPF